MVNLTEEDLEQIRKVVREECRLAIADVLKLCGEKLGKIAQEQRGQER